MGKVTKFLLLCLCFFSLGMSFTFPIFDNKSIIQHIFSKNESVSAVSSKDVEAFIWDPGSGSYGSMPHWEINKTYAKEFLKNNMKWRLQASNNNATWYDANELLNIRLNWNDSDCSYKVTLTLNTTTAPQALYYRFDLACNKSLKKYVAIDGYEWTLTIPANNTKDYTLKFNWSDIKSLIQSKKVWISKGVTNNFFWFRIQSVNKIAVGTVFVVDPLYGIMPATVTDSWEWDPEEGRYPFTVRLNTSQYYLCAFAGDTGSDVDGFVRTFKIWNDNGTLWKTQIDSWEYDTSDGSFPTIVQVPGTDKYAISYRDPDADRAKVVTIRVWDTNGTIYKTLIDSQSLTYDGDMPSMCRANTNVFAVSYTEAGTSPSALTCDGFIETVWIASSGLINNSVLSTLEFNTSDANNTRLLTIDSDTIAVVYDAGTSRLGNIETFNISSAGIISSATSKWKFDSTYGRFPFLQWLSGNVYAITYRATGSKQNIKTLTIAPTGVITKSWIDTLNIGTGYFGTSFTINPASTTKGVYGIIYEETDADGWIATMNISTAGVIDDAIIDSLEFDSTDLIWTALPPININKSWYYITYSGTGSDGWSCTVSINTNWASPTFSNPSPANNSVGQALTPQCAITINDLNGDLMTVNFYENSTGSYVLRQTNSSCANGTYRWTDAQASSYSLKYYWKVYINDGTHNVSNWYCFTTQAPPSQERLWHTLFSGYFKGGNATVPWKSLFSGYLKGGNATIPWRSLFSGYEKGGNATVSWRSLFSGYEKGGNNTIPWRSLFSGYLKGGNITNYRSLFNGYLKGGNATIPWRSLFSGYLKGGNATVPWKSLFSGYLTGGNVTNFRSLFSGYFKGGNITNFKTLFSGYETGGNATVSYHPLFSGWFSGGNTSLDKIYITDIYPVNGSTAAIKTSLTATIEQLEGLTFNISWYGSDDNGSSWFTLGSTINVHNGTWGVGFWNASILNKTYYWRIEIIDTDLNYANATYHYTTAAMGAITNQIQLLGQGSMPLAIMGGFLFVIPLGMLFMIMGKRKKQKEEKQDDRTDDIFNT